MESRNLSNFVMFLAVVGIIAMILLKQIFALLDAHGHPYPGQEMFNMVFPFLLVALGACFIIAAKLRHPLK